jgi:hypothetical protein
VENLAAPDARQKCAIISREQEHDDKKRENENE